MKKIMESFLQWGTIGLGMLFVIVASWVTYAAWNDIVSNGDPLDAASWNGVVEHTVPSGAVVAFDLGACPTGWTEFTALRSRTIVWVWQWPGMSDYTLGQSWGAETVILTPSQMPSHSHNALLWTTEEDATSNEPSGNIFANTIFSDPAESVFNYAGGPVDSTMNVGSIAIATAWGWAAHENRPPYYALRYCKKD